MPLSGSTFPRAALCMGEMDKSAAFTSQICEGVVREVERISWCKYEGVVREVE